MNEVNGTEKGYKGREGKGRGLSEDVSKTGGTGQGGKVGEGCKTRSWEGVT